MRIAIVGLQFGATFVPIYQNHPDVERVVLCDADAARLNEVGDRFGIAERFASLDDLLGGDHCDAVHLMTPVPFHADQTVTVLSAGKHCACAVPMATTLDDIYRIIAAEDASGKNHMMMETGVYTREYLYAEAMYRRGELGNLTFLRGAYFQDLDGGYPDYWKAQPPMHYATHAVAPLLALAKTRATRVCCFGAGRLRSDIQQPGGNTFPLQTAIFRLAGTDAAAAEVTHSWFQVARAYTEAFSVYGDLRGFEWQQIEHEEPIVYTLEPAEPGRKGRATTTTRVRTPDRLDLLPESIARFTEGGHGGSHPHLVHEFVRGIVEGRRPANDARVSADWTAPGICANESSLQDGMPVDIPDFRSVKRAPSNQ